MLGEPDTTDTLRSRAVEHTNKRGSKGDELTDVSGAPLKIFKECDHVKKCGTKIERTKNNVRGIGFVLHCQEDGREECFSGRCNARCIDEFAGDSL